MRMCLRQILILLIVNFFTVMVKRKAVEVFRSMSPFSYLFHAREFCCCCYFKADLYILQSLFILIKSYGKWREVKVSGHLKWCTVYLVLVVKLDECRLLSDGGKERRSPGFSYGAGVISDGLGPLNVCN
ncbi:hypothetical protein L2E82_10339 [Cichorium intybus]|uniref:Uncharacterized protein n=1 Tax=Cichorium intybus TaxID=13427 RepID=A0ACB9GAC6_CICIN|nr:hypothetical protein L2E82_10339 [Cichorium intybus]